MRIKHASGSCTTILVARRPVTTVQPRSLVQRIHKWGFYAQEIVVVEPQDQPRHYQSVLTSLRWICRTIQSGLRRCSTFPSDGIWGAAGINSYNVAVSATETPRLTAVLGADPLIESGISEDIPTLVLPYKTVYEGVLRLGKPEEYGTL